MKRSLLTFAVLAAIALFGCGASAEPRTTRGVAVADVTSAAVISVTGEVVPALWATLSAQAGGTVTAVVVEPGDEVAAGDLLVQIDPTDARLAVREAEAGLSAAQANLARLRAGARPEEIAGAETAVALAQARLAQAEAALDAARAQLAQARAGVQAAQAALRAAQAQERGVKAGPREGEVAAARAEMNLAEARMHQAQAAYDKVKHLPNVAMLPEALTLQEATLSYEAAKARYQTLVAGATEEEREAAAAQVDAARAQVAQAQAQAQAAQAQVAQAEAAVEAARAQVTQAEQQLALLKAGATAEEIAAAEARVAQAQARLEAARVALSRSQVRAPFAATVGAVNVRAGELVTPGQPLVVLGDLSTLRVETTDLDEVDVAQVTVGQQVTVTFDALPERVFTGRITRISPMTRPGTGGVYYTAFVELEEIDPAIRWGMTAFVDIENR